MPLLQVALAAVKGGYYQIIVFNSLHRDGLGRSLDLSYTGWNRARKANRMTAVTLLTVPIS
jgi:hypothetical protein